MAYRFYAIARRNGFYAIGGVYLFGIWGLCLLFDYASGPRGIRVSHLKALAKKYPGEKTADVVAKIKKEIKTGSYVQSLASHNVGRANVFVSHPWSGKFADTVNCLEQVSSWRFLGEDFVWIDGLCRDQFQLNPNEDLHEFFASTIKKVRKVVLVLSNWQSPTVLTRSWCIWEIFNAHKYNRTLIAVFPTADEDHFQITYGQPMIPFLWAPYGADPKDPTPYIDKIVNVVDCKNAKTKKGADKVRIDKEIALESGGMMRVNCVAKYILRQSLDDMHGRYVSKT